MPPASSTRRATASAYLAAFTTWDIDTILTHSLSATATHQIAPASIGQAIGVLHNAEWAARVKSLQGIIRSCTFTVTETVEDEAANQLVLRADGRVVFANVELGGGVYEGEYLFLLGFEEGGERIQRVVEFVDSERVRGEFLRMVEEGQRKSREGGKEGGKS